MAVDAKRVQAVFLAALEATDPVHQAPFSTGNVRRITEMRQRVEALLRAHRESATVLDRATCDPLRGRTNLVRRDDGFDPSAEPTESCRGDPGQDQSRRHEGRRRTRSRPHSTSWSRPRSRDRSAGWATTRCWRFSAGAASASWCGPSTRRCTAWSPSRCWPRSWRHLAGAQALSARGPRLRRVRHEHVVADLRRRGAAASLPGHGVHPGPDLAAEARPDRPAGSAGRAPHRRADRPRPGRRPRAGADPPRHQAGQHPAGKRHRAESRSPTSAWPARPTTPA